ncbi:hypothetical protein [Flavobacterium sp. 3HN19-14]|uniref:hypothetical protein n=1 Tax=Flavobacterium sp. 3HN19-14 TaxID=3448133 RepID=UPI003EE33BD1
MHWSRTDYKSVDTLKSFSGLDAFCDENGAVTNDFPRSLWKVSFEAKEEPVTTVNIHIQYDSVADLEKTLDTGFQEGFTMGMENLDALLAR